MHETIKEAYDNRPLPKPYRALIEILGPIGENALLDAVHACWDWDAWNNDRGSGTMDGKPSPWPSDQAWACFSALNNLICCLGVDWEDRTLTELPESDWSDVTLRCH